VKKTDMEIEQSLLARRQAEFPKTRNIRAIPNLVGGADRKLAETLSPAAIPTPYGVELRCPGDAPEPSPKEAPGRLSHWPERSRKSSRTV